VKDCAFENLVDYCELGALAQLRPAAAGLERSAAHPATGFWSLQNVIAQRWLNQDYVDQVSFSNQSWVELSCEVARQHPSAMSTFDPKADERFHDSI
jgi:hypothetical protein